MDDLDRAKALFFEGLDHLDGGHLKAAAASFRATLAIVPQHGPSLNNLAIVYFKQNRIDELVHAAEAALAADPDHRDAHLILANCRKQQERWEKALVHLERVIALDPRHVEALVNRSFILSRLGRFEESVTSVGQALAIDPLCGDAHLNRGNALRQLKRYDEALGAYDAASRLGEGSEKAWVGRANTLVNMKRYGEAIESCEWVLKSNAKSVEALIAYGSGLTFLKRYDEALAVYDRAEAIDGGLAEIHVGRGHVFFKSQRYDKALDAYDKALAIDSAMPGAWASRGDALLELEKFQEALQAYDHAVTLSPRMPEAWLGRGNVLFRLMRNDEALEAFDVSLSIDPKSEGAWSGRGLVLATMNRDSEALECYDKAIALDSEPAKAIWNKSLLKLSLGDYEDGWRLYEKRWDSGQPGMEPRDFGRPLWLGDSDLTGKTIFIHCEQGFGDTIQFVRYVPLLKKWNCRIVFAVQPALVSLLRAMAWDVDVVANNAPLPASFDVHCPLLSLPLAFKTTLGSVPSDVPYLHADDAKRRVWQHKLGPKLKPRMGLVWSGNPSFGMDAMRSTRFETVGPLISEQEAWFSLSKDIRDVDRDILIQCPDIRNIGPSFDDFAETAAAISLMDLVISTDTSIAHLAGALGKPVWVLLAHHSDFRWLRDRADCPWYPTATLFRQAAPGDWSGVIARVREALQACARAGAYA